MPEKSGYAPGTPSWVDLGTPDVGAAAAFYAGLFGWDHVDAGPHDETMGYGFFLKDGKHVAGVGPLQDEAQPPAWTTYVTIEDADATAQAVGEAGGRVMMGPLDLPADSGRMAIFTDSVGAVICAFQPNQHKGAQLVNEPGSLCWNEHTSRKPEQAQEFYAAVFGWEFREMENPETDYWTLHLESGDGVGGMIRMTDQWPAEVPPHWAVYFAVEDADATAAKVKDLGGSILVEPFDTAVGRIAVVTDAHNAAFSVIALNPEFSG